MSIIEMFNRLTDKTAEQVNNMGSAGRAFSFAAAGGVAGFTLGVSSLLVGIPVIIGMTALAALTSAKARAIDPANGRGDFLSYQLPLFAGVVIGLTQGVQGEPSTQDGVENVVEQQESETAWTTHQTNPSCHLEW